MTNKLKIFIFFAFLFFIFFLTLGNLSDSAQKYVEKADYNYKNNNFLLAQKYYEKAFEKGINKPKYRNNYIDTIFNLPFDTTAQEKLLKFLDSDIEDSATMRAEQFVHDIKNNIERKYPLNYIKQAPEHEKIIRWSANPITYSFTSQEGIQVPEYFKTEIENAFREWEKETDNKITFQYSEKTSNILIRFIENNPAGDNKDKYIVAFTSSKISNDKILQRMFVNFYLKNSKDEYFSQNQIYNTALHEIAHALGFMGHSYDKENIMYLSKDSAMVSQDLRDNLTKADINTMKLLYDIKPDISDKLHADGIYIPHLVIGSKQEILNSKTDEAKNYIRKAPTIASGYIDLAGYLMNNKEYYKAISSLNKALELADTDILRRIVYYDLAVVYFNIDNTEFAKKYILKAQQIKDSIELHSMLADIYAQEKDIKNAVSEYNWLLDKDPKNIEYVIGLTNIYVQQKQYFKARKVLKTYFKLCPEARHNKRLEPYGIIKVFL